MRKKNDSRNVPVVGLELRKNYAYQDASTDVDVRVSGSQPAELPCVLHELRQAARPPHAIIRQPYSHRQSLQQPNCITPKREAWDSEAKAQIPINLLVPMQGSS